MFDIPTASTALHNFTETSCEAQGNSAPLLRGHLWPEGVQNG